ncbi:MAG: hypothetical protein E6K53_04125 [Gammaproteobacteria bacterium]|nr:MAG: hypothetical protein E6K53_04125 [Gammaproteobacteria bacterium]
MFHPMTVEQIVDCTQTSFACSLPAKFLRCGDGYEFRQLNARAAVLMHGDEPGPVVSCGCTGQCCEVRVDPRNARVVVATENACGGNWGWTVRLPGLPHAFKLLAMEGDAEIHAVANAVPQQAANAT